LRTGFPVYGNRILSLDEDAVYRDGDGMAVYANGKLDWRRGIYYTAEGEPVYGNGVLVRGTDGVYRTPELETVYANGDLYLGDDGRYYANSRRSGEAVYGNRVLWRAEDGSYRSLDGRIIFAIPSQSKEMLRRNEYGVYVNAAEEPVYGNGVLNRGPDGIYRDADGRPWYSNGALRYANGVYCTPAGRPVYGNPTLADKAGEAKARQQSYGIAKSADTASAANAKSAAYKARESEYEQLIDDASRDASQLGAQNSVENVYANGLEQPGDDLLYAAPNPSAYANRTVLERPVLYANRLPENITSTGAHLYGKPSENLFHNMRVYIAASARATRQKRAGAEYSTMGAAGRALSATDNDKTPQPTAEGTSADYGSVRKPPRQTTDNGHLRESSAEGMSGEDNGVDSDDEDTLSLSASTTYASPQDAFTVTRNFDMSDPDAYMTPQDASASGGTQASHSGAQESEYADLMRTEDRDPVYASTMGIRGRAAGDRGSAGEDELFSTYVSADVTRPKSGVVSEREALSVSDADVHGGDVGEADNDYGTYENLRRAGDAKKLVSMPARPAQGVERRSSMIQVSGRSGDEACMFGDELNKIAGMFYPRSWLKFVSSAGTDHLGEMYVAATNNGGTSATHYVMVRALRVGSRPVDRAVFVAEAVALSSLSHANVMKLVGVCTPEQPWLLVSEYAPHGDLRNFLRGCASFRNVSVRLVEQVNFALQIARGLEYLHGAGYAHCVLSLRACLVGWNGMIKISRLGTGAFVSRGEVPLAISGGAPVRRLLPWRWLAPEVLLQKSATCSADLVRLCLIKSVIVTTLLST
jgi:hypothetical protein